MTKSTVSGIVRISLNFVIYGGVSLIFRIGENYSYQSSTGELQLGDCKVTEWTNYENKKNKGLLFFPEDYDASKEYPVLVQFYETHSEGLNTYHAPLLSSAMVDVMYFVSNGYIVFMPDVHFTVGSPGQSSMMRW